MTLRFCALGSGSRGNALLVEHEDTLIMIDCGLPLKTLVDRLETVGRSLDDIDALLITHEHGDHSRGIRPFTRKRCVPVWATPGTAQVIDAIDDYERIRSGRELTIGSIDVRPVPVPHDAREPCQFVFRAGGLQFGLLTDTGHVTPVIREALRNCDALAIEFNHDRRMLANGSYPEAVKARVGSKYGHLSNDQTVELIEEVAHDGLNWVMGLHLSEQNNSPDCVRASTARFTDGSQVELRLASQNEPSPWLEVARC